MEKIIYVDLENESDLFEKYNKNIVSEELINYIIKNSIHIDNETKIKIVINTKIKGIDIVSLIKEGLIFEHQKSIKEHERNNIIQILYLILGIFAIFLSTLINETIFKEIILIGGWVLIWTMVEMELFQDNKNKLKRHILKRLIASEIILKK
ncbi:MAG: hypothetical protein PUC23_04805 [bacterium]|nr:hypothetical protein [bacterium]